LDGIRRKSRKCERESEENRKESFLVVVTVKITEAKKERKKGLTLDAAEGWVVAVLRVWPS